MRTCIFDIETSSLYANTGIILTAVIKELGSKHIKVIRADEFDSWKKGKSDNRQVVTEIMNELCGNRDHGQEGYDIFVAHNGQYFDKTFLNTSCLLYGLRPSLRFEKFIDPVLIARKHMRLARNSLASIIDYFDLDEKKTNLHFRHWIKASHDSDMESMDIITKHCIQDVKALELAYKKIKQLVKGIDEYGSGR
jgi:hypothetical protein